MFDIASAFAKNLTKKAAESVAEAALKKGAVKLSEKAAETVGQKLGEKEFRKTSRQNPVRSTKITSGLSKTQVEDLCQSPENSGDEIFKILSFAAKAQPKAKPEYSQNKHYKKIQKSIKRNNQRLRGLNQQEINENLNRLMNM